MTRSTYEVHAEQHGAWWLLTVPAVPGVVSQIEDLQHAEAHAREAIAFVLRVAPDSFDITIVNHRPITDEARDSLQRWGPVYDALKRT